MRAPSVNGKSRTRDVHFPGFILCPARSGSTLLRLILNNHPDIACPAETNLVAIFPAIGFAVAAVSEPERADRNSSDRADEAKQRAAIICRNVADSLMGDYAEAREKLMWVDKSLPSVFYADLLAQIYPDARFICLYRQCLDTIASLHEASSWSYESYGVLPFAQANLGNLAQGLAAYWVDRVSLLQTFEEAHPERTLRLRYEDLVARPEETVVKAFGFLDVRVDNVAVASALAFESHTTPVMPGDMKVRFSRGIDSSSVGRGWTVPIETLTPDLRDRVDSLSRELDYPPLMDLKQCATESATSLISEAAPTGPHTQGVRRLLEERAGGSTAAQAMGAPDGESSLLKLVLADLPEPWMIDFSDGRVEKRDGEANWLALTDSETLMSLVSGQVNPAVALGNSTLQVVSAFDQRPDQFLDRVDELVELLRG